jgi:predicted Zn-dependent protease
MTMDEGLKGRFRRAIPREAEFASLRYHDDREQELNVRHGVLLPPSEQRDEGAMVTVHCRGGAGYSATPDLSLAGLKRAFASALAWAECAAARAVVDARRLDMPHPTGSFESPVRIAWDDVPLAGKIELLETAAARLRVSEAIVDSSAALWRSRSERLYLTAGGGEVRQCFDRLTPMLRATANRGTRTETRTLGHLAWVRQQGLELIDECRFADAAVEVAEDALALLDAEDCPTGKMDLLLDPDQMIIQIHESIGHPLELDRILGDERNYAGRSFVTLDMFGRYRYGSELLNVTVDPTRPEQAASFAFDDDGMAAEKRHLIKDGVLLRPLGGGVSRDRAAESLPGFEGTANARADSWRRPPIDRMPNLNLEPGTARFDDMVASVERGIYMRTNCSWSIDDSRNKFQFGCEWARLIENGRLTTIVRRPGYRGISESFWRSLAAVGDDATFRVLGTPYCGKGEPNQAVFVGHATPACLFRDVDVFGAE